MTVWQRIVRLFRSQRSGDDLSDLSASMDQTYRRQTQLLQQVRRGYADVDTSRRRVELQLAQVRQQEAQLDAEARAAVAAGQDDQARALLGRKLALEKAEAELTDRSSALKAEQERLQATVTKVEGDIEAFRVRKDTLTARRAAASARAEINDATVGINAAGSAIGQAMSDAEQHTRELEATADAVDELVAEGVIGVAGEDPRAAELRRFDAEQAEIERQLASLQLPQEVTDGTDPVQK